MMKRIVFYISFLLLLFVNATQAQDQRRFPKPDFESGYTQPSIEKPEARKLGLEYVDVAILFLVLSLTAYFAIKKPSRKAILSLSIFSLIYFGFYRLGCVCAVGSVQNVSLSIFDSNYIASIPVLAFFFLPLIFALFFGRVFCASACPLGVMQDLVHIKSVKLPHGLQKALSIFPFVYLAFAVLFAATSSDFIICRFDPFIGIYRLNASFHMIVLGISFLLISMFVGRPYCRFVCPYSVPLKWMSRFSKYHLSITPDECINCKLCKDSCPFDAIDYPQPSITKKQKDINFKKFISYIILLPILTFLIGFLFSESSDLFAKVNSKVALSEIVIKDNSELSNDEIIDKDTFLASGKTLEELVSEANIIRNKFYIGSWITGLFVGLSIAFILIQQFVFRGKNDYSPNKANCLSCGRCLEYCPVEKPKSI
jgi:ferredoxin